MREKGQNNHGKMTKEEKNLNKLDLNAFRNKEANIYSMVPGINNFSTIGTAPLNRIRDPVELSTARSHSTLPLLYGNIEDHPIKNALHDRSKPTCLNLQRSMNSQDQGSRLIPSLTRTREWTHHRL